MCVSFSFSYTPSRATGLGGQRLVGSGDSGSSTLVANFKLKRIVRNSGTWANALTAKKQCVPCCHASPTNSVLVRFLREQSVSSPLALPYQVRLKSCLFSLLSLAVWRSRCIVLTTVALISLHRHVGTVSAAAPPSTPCCTASAYSALAIEQKAVATQGLQKLESYLDASAAASLVVVSTLGGNDTMGYLMRGDQKMVCSSGTFSGTQHSRADPLVRHPSTCCPRRSVRCTW